MDGTPGLGGRRLTAGAPVPRDISAQLADARARVARLPGSTLAFGVIRMWPDQPVAEHENVERMRVAADLIGATVIELDRHGRILKSPGEFVTGTHVDFVLNLHFETAKSYDAISIGAMWNPFSFYSEWGFNRFWANQMSHDIFATTGAAEIDSLIRRERGAAVAAAMPVLNHSLSSPIYAPVPKASYRAFYCGINWEKVDGRPGRHGEVLSGLDARHKLDLYGPETVKGVRVWDGYRGYRGSLPFDGRTVVDKIWQAGACLVLSSDAHKASRIMSNRLFEALAGGAVVIGDEHPFIAHAIGEHYIRVPTHLPAAKRVEMIVAALAELERDPDRARALAAAAQENLLERYLLSTQLAGLFEAAHRLRAERLEALQAPGGPVIDIVIQPIVRDAREITNAINALAASFGAFANLIVLAPEDQTAWFENRFGSVASVVGVVGDGRVMASPSGCMEAVAHCLKTRRVAFFLGIETVFAESYLAACAQFAGRPIGRIGHAIEHHDESGAVCLDYQSPHAPIDMFHPSALASLVFDRDWLAAAPNLHGLPWQALARMAESADDCIAASSPTAVTINVKRYEWALRAGVGWTTETADTDALVERFGGERATLPSGLVLRPNLVPPPFGGDELVRAFKQLSARDKLRIGLELYHAVPLPRWLQRAVRLARRGLRIR